MTILQLNPPIPMYCIGDNFFPRGACVAHFLSDPGLEYNDSWKCCMNDGGKWYDIPNQLMRGQENFTMLRNKESQLTNKDICL